MKYELIEKQCKRYAVGMQCGMLTVSRSGYYAWRKRQKEGKPEAHQALIEHIRRIHKKSRKTYGSPRVHAELRAERLLVNHKRVARLMRLEGIQGQRKRRKGIGTDSKRSHPVAPNLLNREFGATKPNEKWVADITYIFTQEGWLYLAVIMDLYSRKIVGWSMGPRPTAELVEDALRMALYERQPDPGLLHHSDRGSQYASDLIHTILVANGIQVSMSRKANCYDNAVVESFFSTLKCEWVYFLNYKTRKEASLDIFKYIATFYNTIRRHSTLGYVSPNQFEANDQKTP
jgi:putative transposase